MPLLVDASTGHPSFTMTSVAAPAPSFVRVGVAPAVRSAVAIIDHLAQAHALLLCARLNIVPRRSVSSPVRVNNSTTVESSLARDAALRKAVDDCSLQAMDTDVNSPAAVVLPDLPPIR